ncbi:MAG: hypothetical protein IK083_06415 [Abditibacteriota bacterium]|nr:hypothetical protein [Abditibacteriota bacterium]
MKQIFALLLLCSLCVCAWSADCRIMGGGYEAFLVKAGSATLSREQRARVIQERMNDVMSLEQAPMMRLQKQKDGSVMLWAGNIFIATVGKRDADAGPGTCMQIAQNWAQGINSAYALAAAPRGKPADAKPSPSLKTKKPTRHYKK